MRIERITYKRIKNLGNYESETLEMGAILEEGESAIDSCQELKQLVNYCLNSKPIKSENEPF